MAPEKDKKQNIPLQKSEEQLIEEHTHNFRDLLMLFHQLGCKKVLEIPFEQSGEKYKVRVEKVE
jgi:hypothetical protein